MAMPTVFVECHCDDFLHRVTQTNFDEGEFVFLLILPVPPVRTATEIRIEMPHGIPNIVRCSGSDSHEAFSLVASPLRTHPLGITRTSTLQSFRASDFGCVRGRYIGLDEPRRGVLTGAWLGSNSWKYFRFQNVTEFPSYSHCQGFGAICCPFWAVFSSFVRAENLIGSLAASLGLPPPSKRSCKSAPNMDGEERLPPGVSRAGFD